MKKIVAVALCLVLSSILLVGCSNDSEPFEQKSYTSDTQIQEINLEVQDREIEVSLSQANKFIFNILKTARNTTIFPFLRKMC